MDDNAIDPTALIADNVILGRHNVVGRNVVIAGFKGAAGGEVRIGDCNVFHENTRILAGPEGIVIGDWNVFHNTMLVMGGRGLSVGHNCWFGQNTILDGAGELRVGNGVRVGMYSQVWTHVASGELIEGCTLFAHRATAIEDDVWLVGSCIVGSGLTLGRRSVCLIGSNVTKDTAPDRVYAGAPAKLMERMSAYRPVEPAERLGLMVGWLEHFVQVADDRAELALRAEEGEVRLTTRAGDDCLVFALGDREGPRRNPGTTHFDLLGKTYTKRLSPLERRVYRYLYDHKARFIPRA